MTGKLRHVVLTTMLLGLGLAFVVIPSGVVAAGATVVRVNAGGSAYTDAQGNSWSADCCNSGGNVYSTTASIANTSDAPLYQSERWNSGSFAYTFTGLAAGS